MQNCPKYLSAPTPTARKSRQIKLQEKGQKELANALRVSVETYAKHQQYNQITNLQQIKKICLKQPWKLLKNENELFICTVSMIETAGPAISAKVCIDEKLLLTVYIQSIQLTSFNQHRFPLKVDSPSDFSNVCEEPTLKNSKENSNLFQSQADHNFIVGLNLILSLLIPLQDNSFKFCTVIKFVRAQLSLLTKNKNSFSYDFLLLSSLLYNVSPHAYRFMRSSGSVILPCYTTIRKIALSSSMSPSIEQADKTFLFYIKQKFQFLSSSDMTVTLLQ